MATILAPWDASQDTQFLKWALESSKSEFFRRYPPTMDLASPERLRAVCAPLWGVYDDNVLVGCLQLCNVDQYSRSCEIGGIIDIQDSSERRRVSASVLQQAANYIFNYMNFNRITVRVLEHRAKLKEGFEAFGFQPEALLRESALVQGTYQNEWLLGCLKHEFVWA